MTGNPRHFKCAICKKEFEDKEQFTAWSYENVFFLFTKRYPVHWACAKEENVPILEKLAKEDSINNVMSIQKNAFEVDLEYNR